MATPQITSVCINRNKNTWIVMDGNIFVINDITNPNSVWSRLTQPSGVNYVKQISSTTKNDDGIAIIDNDNMIWYATENILNSPNWKRAPYVVKMKCINLNSNMTFFSIGVDNNLYRLTDLKGAWVKLPKPNGGSFPNPGDPIQINDYNIGYSGWSSFLDSKGTMYFDSNVYSGNINVNNWWKNLQVNIPGVTNYVFQNSNEIWIIQNGYLRFKSNVGKKPVESGYVQVGSDTNNRLITTNNFNIFVVVQGDNTIKWGENSTIKGSNTNRLIPPKGYYGTLYYGNSIPVTKAPYTITLTNVPVKNWRRGIEYHHNNCGYSSTCDSFNRNKFPYSNDGLAIEAPNYTVKWIQAGGRGGCVAGQGEAWCWVPEEFLTHVFGQNYSASSRIPVNTGTQYPPSPDKPSAWDLQITPFNKQMNTPDGKMSSKTAVHSNIRYFDNDANRPIFKSIQFNIPDPTEPNVNAVIPSILLQYYIDGNLSLEILNDYMVKYAFTPIKQDNKIIPRYVQSTGSNMVPIPPNEPINLWKAKVGQDFFNTAALRYCSGDNVNTEYCYNYCSNPTNNCDENLLAFCRAGGSGTSKLPQITPGVLSRTPITLDMLKQGYPKYFDNSKNTCGCFMPDDFYNYLDQYSLQQIGTSPEEFADLYKRKIFGIGGAKCNQFSNCTGSDVVSRKSQKDFQCPSINLQQCIQKNIIELAGDSQSNTFQNKQTMNCIQNVTNTTSNNSGDTKPTLKEQLAKAEADKIEADRKAAADKAAADKAATDKAAADKVEAKVEPDTKAAADKVEAKAEPGTKAADPPSKMSPAVIAAIIVVLILLLGGGAFFMLK